MIDILVDEGIPSLAGDEDIKKAIVLSCFEARNIENISLCLRFASDDAVQELNAEWRDKDKVTDVLSFPMQEAGELDEEESLGDMIIATPFVQQEAKRLNLTDHDHILHLVVHGTLHLLGYDHIEDDEAEVMQKMENKVMKKLGLHQPYPEFSDEVRS